MLFCNLQEGIITSNLKVLQGMKFIQNFDRKSNWNFTHTIPKAYHSLWSKKRTIKWDLCSSGMLCGIDAVLTDVSGQPIGPETLVTNYRSTLHNIPEEWRSHSHHGKSLKSTTKECRKSLPAIDYYIRFNFFAEISIQKRSQGICRYGLEILMTPFHQWQNKRLAKISY